MRPLAEVAATDAAGQRFVLTRIVDAPTSEDEPPAHLCRAREDWAQARLIAIPIVRRPAARWRPLTSLSLTFETVSAQPACTMQGDESSLSGLLEAKGPLPVSGL